MDATSLERIIAAYGSMLPDSGHLPWLDDPKRIGKAAADFLHVAQLAGTLGGGVPARRYRQLNGSRVKLKQGSAGIAQVPVAALHTVSRQKPWHIV